MAKLNKRVASCTFWLVLSPWREMRFMSPSRLFAWPIMRNFMRNRGGGGAQWIQYQTAVLLVAFCKQEHSAVNILNDNVRASKYVTLSRIHLLKHLTESCFSKNVWFCIIIKHKICMWQTFIELSQLCRFASSPPPPPPPSSLSEQSVCFTELGFLYVDVDEIVSDERQSGGV